MNRLQKNYWYSKYILILIILGIGFLKAYAQSSFFYECEALFARDVFEDSKGCIIAKTEDRVIRLSPNGTLIWEFEEYTLSQGINIQDSQRYVFSAFSSELGGFGMASFDYRGHKLWSHYIDSFPEAKTILDIIHDTLRKQFVVAGIKKNIGVNTKEYFWIAGVDYRGNIVWENYWRDEPKNLYFKKIFKNPLSQGYLLTSESHQSIAPELINVDSLGNLIDSNPIEPNPCISSSRSEYFLKDIILYCDTMFIASIIASSSNDCPNGGIYFYFYNSKGRLFKRLKNDWAYNLIKQTRNKTILIGGGNFIGKLNNKFELEWISEIFIQRDSQYINIKKIAQSKDGGYYGIADGYKVDKLGNWTYLVYVFKTDSLGNINQKEEYNEKKETKMLQPNPASQKVRIAIPYYYGKVSAKFYNMHGVFLFEKTKDEQDMYDISSLSPGIYLVKARIEETGETRTMRLIVQ